MLQTDRTAAPVGAAVVQSRFQGASRQAEASTGPKSWLSRLASLIAAEHVCAPPDARFVAVPTEFRLTRAESWTCPECEQVHAPRSTAKFDE